MRNNSVTAILLVMAGIAWGGAFGGGSGTQKDPWQIGSALELNEIGADPQLWDRHFILMADLDLSELDGCDGRPGFNTIGIYVDEYSRDNHPFTGSFNGNGHIITGLTIHDADKNYVGLFNAVDGDAYLKDICLTEVDIQSETAQGTGGLAGIFLRGWIMNCTVKGGVVTVRQGHAGGLVGQLLNFNKLFRCCSEITVISEQGYAGGLVGLVNRGSLQECYARGRVLGNSVAGGLAGQGRWLFVKDSYSQCDISGIICGGLVGQTIEVGNVLENTYAAGLLSGENVGGLIGSCEYTMVCDSYWDQDICGTILSDGGGVPKSQSAMRNVNTFYGWGCDAKWRLNNGAEYPALAWQNAMGSIIRKPEQPYGGGSGESYDPYLICTPAQLNAIGLYETDWNKCFKLMADLDLAGMEFNVIGHLNRAYNGCFDGNGYTIYNLTIKAARRSCCGLLGNVTNNLMISNLTLDHPRIENGDKQVGALIGKLSAGGPTIRNCHAIHAFVAGQDYCGGLIGNVIDGVAVTLERCSVTGRIQGNNFVWWRYGSFRKWHHFSMQFFWYSDLNRPLCRWIGGSDWLSCTSCRLLFPNGGFSGQLCWRPDWLLLGFTLSRRAESLLCRRSGSW